MSWPVTLAILVLAFGALVAAGLPLILTLSGLVASAGSLVLINEPSRSHLGDELRHDVRPRARASTTPSSSSCVTGGTGRPPIRGPPAGRRRPHWRSPRRWTPQARSVLLSGLTVLGSLSAVMLVPSRPPLHGGGDQALGGLRARRDAHPSAAGAVQARPPDHKFALPGRTEVSTARRSSPPGASASGSAPSPGASPPWWCCWPSLPRSWGCRPPCRRSRSCPRTPRPASATTACRSPSVKVPLAPCRSSPTARTSRPPPPC